MVGGQMTRTALAAIAAIGCLGLAAQAAPAATKFKWFEGYDEASTPKSLDKVGVLRVGPRKANKILILNPGTSGAAAYFYPLARQITSRTKGLQVWSIERRGTQLEDQSVFDEVKRGEASVEEMFDYYLNWLTDSSIEDHFDFIPDSEVGFGREWGMKVAVKDLRRVVRMANRKADTVIMGGHSLGGSITTAYATWDFNGNPGAKNLDGLVFIDGGSGPEGGLTAEEATAELDELAASSPWLSFGGIQAPFTGLFNGVGANLMLGAPNEPSVLHDWPLLPGNLKAPVLTTNKAGYGFALDAETSPSSLRAAQVNAGKLASTGEPRGWIRDGEITPLRRVANMFAAPQLQAMDGTAWYHPTRLNLDAGGIAAGNDNPAQDVLDLDATRGGDLGPIPIYAFGAALGGQRVVDSAAALARQSGVPDRKLRLVNRESTYTHVDPLSARPKNAFVNNLLRFMRRQVG